MNSGGICLTIFSKKKC